jgi:putative SOS response-associated peptidase YedK
MCYSAQVLQDYRRYLREHGAKVDLPTFAKLFWERHAQPKLRLGKAMELAFADSPGEGGDDIRAAIGAWRREEATRLEQELFKQRKRLADAERKLATRTTKAATESRRIATDKVQWLRGRLDDLRRTTPEPRDSRIYPGHYCPVMVSDGGQRVLRPMRYQCRPEGKPASYDRKYPGTYNARRDNLEGFWKGQFGHTHAVVSISAFYENVSRHRAEGRALAEGEAEENVVLEFRPDPQQEMLIACLWSRWTGKDGEELHSFAAITDEPPPEVAAAGHDRCVIPIRPGHVDAWLNPDPANLDALYAILDDRERPYYEHRMAA